MKLLKESTLEDLGIPLLEPFGEWEYVVSPHCNQVFEHEIGLGAIHRGWKEWDNGTYFAGVIYARRRPRPTIELPSYEGATPNTKYGLAKDAPAKVKPGAIYQDGRWFATDILKLAGDMPGGIIVAYEDKENN